MHWLGCPRYVYRFRSGRSLDKYTLAIDLVIDSEGWSGRHSVLRLLGSG